MSGLAPPSDKKLEVTMALIKGALGSIPFVGSVATELTGLIDPLEARKDKWASTIAKVVEEIRESQKILPETLAANESFISFLYQSTHIAILNHQQEKTEALRNALISTVSLRSPSEDIIFQYLRYIDELTVSHINILSFINEHAETYAKHHSLEEVLITTEQHFSSTFERSHFRAIMYDLANRSLVQFSDLDDFDEFASGVASIITEQSSKKPMNITKLGKGFLDFIHR